MLLLTAASGRQAKLLLPKLGATGIRIRGARVTPGRDGELLRAGADEVFVGDLKDMDTCMRALEGVETVYQVGPAVVADDAKLGITMIEAAKRSGLRHFIFSSVFQPSIDILRHLSKRDVEEKLVESGLNYTVLRPCDYMMEDVYIKPVLERGELPIYWQIQPDRRASYIALDDLTDVAVKIVREGPTHYFASYDLAGTDRLSIPDIAKILSRELGKDVKVIQKTADDLLQYVWGGREPTPEMREKLIITQSMMNWYSKYSLLGNPTVLTMLLGRPPTTFEEFVRKATARLRMPGAEA